MLHVIEVGAEIDVNDTSLACRHRLSHSVHRLMRCPLGTVSIRPRLEISFKDRLQDELEGSLDHAVADTRNRKNADFSPVLRNFLIPRPHGPIRLGDQFVPDLPQKTLLSSFLDGLERDLANARCPVILFRHPVGFAKRLHLADMNVKPPETPGRFSLRLDVFAPSQVLQTHGCLCHLTLASLSLEQLQTAGLLRSTDITPLLRYYEPLRSLLVFHRLPGCAGYTACLLRRFRDGTRRASPVA